MSADLGYKKAVPSFTGSPRLRRRLVRLAAGAVVCLVFVVVFLLLPNTNGNVKSTFSNEPAQRVISERQVPVTPRRRAEVNALFDAFVPAAVERRNPGAAYELVTPTFRGGTSRVAWRKGDLPVYPYEPRGGTFHGWTVDLSYRERMSVQLFLQPRNPKNGPVAFSVDLRRLHGRWLIDAFYPRTGYAPVAAAAGSHARTKPEAASGGGVTATRKQRGLMWVVLVSLFSLVVAVPLCIFAGQWFEARRGRRRFRGA